MLNFLLPYSEYLQLAANGVVYLLLGASVLVKTLPKFQPYAPKLLDFETKFFKILRWLPSFGFDPKTKQLESVLLNYKKEI